MLLVHASNVENESDHPFGALRLSSEIATSEGERLLEVFNFDRWGQVCSRSFDSNAALVACKELGFVNSTSFAP